MSTPLTLVPPSNGDPFPVLSTQHSALSTPRLALRVGEAAEAISVCRATFWRLMRAGEIPVVHIGGMKRILRRDLEAWLEAHKE